MSEKKQRQTTEASLIEDAWDLIARACNQDSMPTEWKNDAVRWCDEHDNYYQITTAI